MKWSLLHRQVILLICFSPLLNLLVRGIDLRSQLIINLSTSETTVEEQVEHRAQEVEQRGGYS